MLAWTRDQALKALNLSPDIPVLLVFGGSKGARSINQALELILARSVERDAGSTYYRDVGLGWD